MATLSGAISSPYWPERYFPGLHCYTTVQVAPDYRILLTLRALGLQRASSGKCLPSLYLIHLTIEMFDRHLIELEYYFI